VAGVAVGAIMAYFSLDFVLGAEPIIKDKKLDRDKFLAKLILYASTKIPLVKFFLRKKLGRKRICLEAITYHSFHRKYLLIP